MLQKGQSPCLGTIRTVAAPAPAPNLAGQTFPHPVQCEIAPSTVGRAVRTLTACGEPTKA